MNTPPLWVAGTLLNVAVNGSAGLAATASVGALVRDSELPASSEKLTPTAMVLPWWLEVSRRVVPVAPAMFEPSASHW